LMSFLQDLPSQGITLKLKRITPVQTYIATHSTDPHPSQVIKTAQTSVLMRQLQFESEEARECKRKLPAASSTQQTDHRVLKKSRTDIDAMETS